MNRRSFLKYLSSIPLIGIPVKLLAKAPEVKKYGEYVQAGFDNVPYDDPIPDNAVSLAEKRNKDPYADVEHIPWGYPKIISGKEMNTDFGKITLNRGVSWLD